MARMRREHDGLVAQVKQQREEIETLEEENKKLVVSDAPPPAAPPPADDGPARRICAWRSAFSAHDGAPPCQLPD